LGLPMIVVGPDDSFTRSLASELKADIIPIARRTFPDGELQPRLMVDEQISLKGETVILAMRMKAASCRPNDYLVEYLLTLRNLKKEMQADRVIAVIPYFPYARQDEIFRPGEPLSSKYVAEMLEAMGADAVVSVTVHLHRLKSFSDIFDRILGVNVSGIPSLAREASKFDLKDPLIIGPDEEAIIWAEEFAKHVGARDYTSFIKERDRETGEIKMTVREFDLTGRDVVVVDDIVSTGGTMASAIAAAKRMGASRVFSAFVHPVLAEGALDKILGAGGDVVIAGDTLEWLGSRATVVPELGKTIKEML